MEENVGQFPEDTTQSVRLAACLSILISLFLHRNVFLSGPGWNQGIVCHMSVVCQVDGCQKFKRADSCQKVRQTRLVRGKTPHRTVTDARDLSTFCDVSRGIGKNTTN